MAWPMKRLKFVAKVNPRHPRLPEAQLVTFVPMEAIGARGGLDVSAERSAGEVTHGYTSFADGDVLVAKITPCFENGKGAIAGGLRGGVGFGTTELHVVRACPTANRRFLFYVTQSNLFMALGESEMYGAGGQKRVPPEFVQNFALALPPLHAQQAIADFLDKKTAAIDALIAKKERLIELLQEKRQALITQVVTKGLDANVPMKESGVEWLGEIPAHWEVRSLRRLIRHLDQGWSPVADDRIANDGEWGVLKLSAISDGEFDWTQHKTLDAVPEMRYATFRLQRGDLLITRANTVDLVGACAVVREECPVPLIMSDLIYRLKPNALLEPEWASLFLRSSLGRLQIARDARGSSMSMAKVSQGQLLDWMITAPPQGEQLVIAEHVRARVGESRAIEQRVRRHIEVLREYRQALITEAVTGKLDIPAEPA
jgi:type I restriction enzyme S subunit